MVIDPAVAELDNGDIPRKRDDDVKMFTFMGYSILVGLNAYSNEKMVAEHKEIHPNCLWFHAVGCKGPHVILCIEGRTKPETLILRRAAYKALEGTRTGLNQTQWSPLQDVYKPEGQRVGVFRTWRTEVIQL